MKTFIFSIALMSAAFTSFGQDMLFPKKTVAFSIICKLFESKEDNVSRVCVWKPNLSEKIKFGYPKDMLYTKLDTVIPFKNDYGIYYLIITSTYQKDETGDFESCHSCAPVMGIIKVKFNQDSSYSLISFDKYITKYGSWGKKGKVGLLRLSDNDFAVKVTESYTEQGEHTENVKLYHNGNQLLGYMSEYIAGDETYKTTLSVDYKKRLITLDKKSEIINERKRYWFDTDGYLQPICE